MKIFYLTDLGEGLPDAEIREWYIKEGDGAKTDLTYRRYGNRQSRGRRA